MAANCVVAREDSEEDEERKMDDFLQVKDLNPVEGEGF